VLVGTKATVFTVYIRAGSLVTVTGIKGGNYAIYLTSGVDWDAGVPGFSRDCGYSKFADPIEFTNTGRQYTVWTITLKPTAGGNAATEPVDPAEFPA